MTRPNIIAVDDDRQVLNAVERDLRQKYGRDYRVLKADSGAAALDLLKELQARNEAVALFVVDQRMPQMTGVEFLQEAIPLFPSARKVMLTAYADTEAAIAAINRVGLDYYLMKPWDPPSEHLYPVLDGLLEDWQSQVIPEFEGVRVVGAMWSAECHAAKDFLGRHSVPFRWLDIDRDDGKAALAAEADTPDLRLPVILFPDGSQLVQPTPEELATKIGLRTRAESPHYDVVVLGGGPAGLSAAVYASCDGLKVLLIERNAPGGQAGHSPKIENFLGFPSGISGSELARRAVAQATRFGAEILTTVSVTGIRADGHTKTISLSNGSEVTAQMVLIATGAWFHTLTAPAAEQWNGIGVYYGAAQTEALQYRDQEVVVIGAANSAAQAVLHLAKYVKQVRVLIRGAEPTWSRYLDVAIREAPNVELFVHTEFQEFRGENGHLVSVKTIDNQSGEEGEAPAAAVFVFIGQRPQSDFLGDAVQRTGRGHVLTGYDVVRTGSDPNRWPLNRDPMVLETSMPGVFAAGDVRSGSRNGISAAIGDGNAVASMFWQYLATL